MRRGLAHPAFAVTATARDLARFLAHFAPGGPRIHTEATVKAMARNQTGLADNGSFPGIIGYELEGPRPWGYGWALQTAATPGIFSDLASFSTFGHGGASGCHAFVDPDEGVSVVILTNTHLRTWLRGLVRPFAPALQPSLCSRGFLSGRHPRLVAVRPHRR